VKEVFLITDGTPYKLLSSWNEKNLKLETKMLSNIQSSIVVLMALLIVKMGEGVRSLNVQFLSKISDPEVAVRKLAPKPPLS